MEGAHWDGNIGDSALLEEGKASKGHTTYLEAIPPPYPQQKHSAPSDVPNAHPGRTIGAPAYPPHPYHAQETTRTLHIYHEDWKGSDVRIMDTDDVTELFRVRLKWKKPHLSITSTRTGETMGTATYHCLSCRIDTTVRGSPISMTPCGILGRRGHMYSSPARGSVNMRWKSQNCNLDLVCLDEHDVPIARFYFSNWSMHRCGRLELMGPTANDGGAVMEEVIVTGLAMAEYVRTTRLTAAVAGANA